MNKPKTIKIDEDVWRAFKHLCYLKGRKPSEVLRELIEDFVRSQS